MSLQQEALPRRGIALREAFHRVLKAALQCPPVEVDGMQEIAADFPSLSHRYIVGIHELYGQAEFEDICEEVQLLQRLSTLEQTCQEQGLHTEAAVEGRVARVPPSNAARACRVQAKQQEVQELKALLSQAQKQQAQAQQALQSKCAELQQAASSFDPIVQQLDEVHAARVIKCLKELEMDKSPEERRTPNRTKPGVHVVGSSGGACAGAYLFLDADIDGTVEFICQCAEQIAHLSAPHFPLMFHVNILRKLQARSSWFGMFKIRTYVKGALDNFMPPGAGPKLTGHMEISLTKLPWFRNVRVTAFDSNEKVKNDILTSSCALPIPPIWSQEHKAWCMDGCFSDFDLIKGVLAGRRFLTMHNEQGISVCPFTMSRADITPSHWIPPWWAAYPPAPEKLREVYQLGYRDAVTWLQTNGHLNLGMMDENGAMASTDGAEERPLWKQILEESDIDVGSCQESFKDTIQGLPSLFRYLFKCLVWALVFLELLCAVALSSAQWCLGLVSSAANRETAANRFGDSAACGKWALLKALPVAPCVPKEVNNDQKLHKQLRDHSFIYRLFRFLIK
eukprot:jgi/Astpho2/2948/fgenesh1_pg.00050_%23_180_t